MVRTLFALAAAVALAPAVTAADQKFDLNPANTKIGFTGTKTGGKHDGGFNKFAGTATVTDKQPTTLKIDLTIETESLFADDPKLTMHLKSPDFFGVKDHPTAKFANTAVTKTAAGFDLAGDLTLLGKTKRVTIPAAIGVTDGNLTIKGETKINRTEWGMTYGKGMIDDLVTVRVDVNAKK